MPPTKDIETSPQRVSLEATRPDLAVSIPLTVKNGFKVKQGDVIGKITASGLYRRRARTTTAGAGFAANSTIGEVADASVFAPGDVLTKSDGTAIGTIAANGVNTVTNQVTLTANAANAVAAGLAVIATDGSAVATAISDKESDGVGDTVINALIAGYLDEAKLRGLEATAKTELGGASAAGGIFKF